MYPFAGVPFIFKNMWVEELNLENIKCFDKLKLPCGDKNGAFKWITLLGENGVGKSTILQALGLLLAGPDGANQLLTKPLGWLRDEKNEGKISARIHKEENDPGVYGDKKQRAVFNFTYFITGTEKITIRSKIYTEPAIVPNSDKTLSWLRQNAFQAKGKGWFASGYGAFRRLTKRNQVIVPSLQSPERFTGFLAQFNEDEPLAAFEQWFVHLDYRMAKREDALAKKQQELGVAAINRVLPEGNKFDSVRTDGKILFDVNGQKVATLNLSDGYRSVLALAGDLIWRLFMAFPESDDPMQEHGTVLIDELDIHLHPVWQRQIPGMLRKLFPNLQFIVSTHSPFIASGSGDDAVTYRLNRTAGQIELTKIQNMAFLSVEKVLQSEAFEVVSLFSKETQMRIDRYYTLRKKNKRTPLEDNQLMMDMPIVQQAIGLEAPKSDLENKMDQYLNKMLK
jgi:predicted ATP-binding protein involved in virulence